jgi:hypothetical protein
MPMSMPIRARVPGPAALAPLLCACLLAGCATPLRPVADFGGAANHLATLYKPFAAGMGASCEQRLRYQAIGNAGPFDDAVAQAEAARECGPLKKAAATAGLFAQALSDYATALAKLAGTKPTAYDSDIKGVSSAAGQLEHRDGTALFDSKKLGAASKLARAAAAMMLQVGSQRLARSTLEENQDALATVVDAMKTYAGAIYAGQLQDTQDVMKGELGRLVAASNAPTQADVEARLPWRFAQSTARVDIAANEHDLRRVRAFAKSADALLAAHTALIDNFDKLDGAARLALVSAFVDRVEAIDDDVAAL